MFVVLEGIDGSGKSTQARKLREWLSTRGHDVLAVREPGGTPFGEEVRRLLLDPGTGDLETVAELFLFMAARAQLCRRVISPALSAGRTVVGDRFIGSSIVYQGAVGGLGVDTVRSVGELAIGDAAPDLTIVLDVDPALGWRRVSGAPDRVEQRGLEYQCALREAYLALVAQGGADVVRVDATGTVDEVHARIVDVVQRRLTS